MEPIDRLFATLSVEDITMEIAMQSTVSHKPNKSNKSSLLMRTSLVLAIAGLALSANAAPHVEPRGFGETGPLGSWLAEEVVAEGGAVDALAEVFAPANPNPRADKPTPEAGPESGPDEELPVTTITLYRSGVGYFERHGLVDGDADVQLNFDASQINDILKSMILLDLDGGRIESVGYGSREPIGRRLASFGIDISDNPDIATLLTRLRGAPVRLDLPAGAVAGTVLGVESRTVAGEGETHKANFVNLITNAGIRSININDVAAMTIEDTELAGELNKALAALAEQRADRVKTVDIALRGSGARRIVAAYVHEMPVWKTSYRLVLPEGSANGSRSGDDLPTIQGWAIVENTTDEDWNDVQLSLVAGRPISFQMDLYEPLHAYRPMVPVPTVPGVGPRVYGGGEQWDEMAKLSSLADKRKAEGSGASPFRDSQRSLGTTFSASAPVSADLLEMYSVSGEDMANSAASAAASGVDVGEVFQFRLDSPVTIERQRSAMIPIISTPIQGRRVSIFNRYDGSKHPMRGVEITNSTDLQLMPGPISVYDGASYAGDAQVGHVPAGDKRLLAYAIDVNVSAIVKDDGTSTIQGMRIVKGLLEQTTKRVQTVTYAFANNDLKRDRTIVIEHAKMGGWDLVSPKKPAEETESVYRFEVAVEADDDAALPVRLERIDRNLITLASMNIDTLQHYVRRGKVSDKVLAAFREAARMQASINSTQRTITQLDAEVSSISKDQARVRQNMNSIDRKSELYTRYIRKFDTQETRLEQIRNQRESEQQRLNNLKKQLADYLQNLNVS